MSDSLLVAGRWFLILTAELVALFLAVSFLVGLLQAWVSEERIRSLLARKSRSASYVAGAALGAITPFCSCSTVPLLAGLLRSRAPFGPSMAFLIASPLLHPVILGLMVLLVGVRGTVLYAAVGFLGAIAIGALWARFGLEADVKPVVVRRGKIVGDTRVPLGRRAWREAWSFFVPMLPFLVLGTAIGALIYGFVPSEWIIAVAGPEKPLAIPAAALIGIPLYIRAETLIPIAQALLGNGMGVGAVIALIIGGAGASIPEISLLSGLFRRRLVASFIASILAFAVAAGGVFTIVGV